MKKVVVAGGGPAGMMAAIQSAKRGNQVILFEKNEKLGKKLFITGKGRCNITNACDVSDLFSYVISNPKFLYSAFYNFTNEDVVAFLNGLGLRTKEERGKRVFPASDKSSDVIRVLQNECKKQGVVVQFNTAVKDLLISDGAVRGIELRNGKRLDADAVILATGGVSYPSTGSTGDGLKIAQKWGHTVTPLRPGLTGMTVKENYGARLMGLTLKNCALWMEEKGKKKPVYQGFGELLFTHYGVSGPLILSASSRVGDCLERAELILHVDLKPALTAEQVQKRLLKEFEARKNCNLHNALGAVLPKSMIPVFLEYCRLKPDAKVNQVTREERRKIEEGLKDFSMTLTGLRGMDEAIITRGGIRIKEVDPSTMESKIVSGLYFAGEILDVDALTGGFNLQIAWSTGYTAGLNIEREDERL